MKKMDAIGWREIVNNTHQRVISLIYQQQYTNRGTHCDFAEQEGWRGLLGEAVAVRSRRRRSTASAGTSTLCKTICIIPNSIDKRN